MRHDLAGPLVFLMVLLFSGGVPSGADEGPADALTIQVRARRWMWEFDHGGGVRAVGTLRVPAGRPVRLVFTSLDIMHRFAAPELGLKVGVEPGKQRQVLLGSRPPGRFEARCMRYCGAGHEHMRAEVVVLAQDGYERWIEAQSRAEARQGVGFGKEIFERFGCPACHTGAMGGPPPGPTLSGLYGTTRRMTDGGAVRADEAYLRESILSPSTRIVAGYQAVMPSFQGVLDERQLNALIAYLKSLGRPSKSKR